MRAIGRGKAGPALAVTALLAAGCGSQVAPPPPKDDHAVQIGPPGAASCPSTSPAQNAAGAAATNAPRRAAGLAPVVPDPLLARVAAAHACDMARRGRMTHLGSTTTGPAMRVKEAGYRPALSAENIAAGPFSLTRVLAEWTASPGHRANILLPQIRDYGLGQALGPDGRNTYWVAVYAAPQ
ncbi:CAP domain-containing protein [Paracoccus gahaiensis]|uniref:CAP domain-containing protein n=1 Tax=Paracoccus gahaiensis TaxID=1706839 RepID=A0A4U0RYB9_9RHOB|nr:CAP domain-containing protein [Paracoccus gahaiensis]TJZ93354.1 CAP domain-containing protein [Paracoccus gahaiensis]